MLIVKKQTTELMLHTAYTLHFWLVNVTKRKTTNPEKGSLSGYFQKFPKSRISSYHPKG